ncbi:phage major capsid protein [Arthrobacter burdickii]|uniref:Phage major capsid protein n=1 Tax=Arthrobacter burdickii TaxID=3035920 RepID=A0ABT8K0Y1_9MICC|nr:phage major capsid protein [Arthrobacter burdickii]MDN4611075.1 phage major capsid protein [Arthrobacter burdickii]
MTNVRREKIRAAALADIQAATAIAEKAEAEGRNMTADELADYGRAMTRAKDGREQLRQLDTDDEVTRQARALAAEVGGAPGTGAKRLALTGAGRKDSARVIAGKMMTSDGFGGRKALTDSGSIVTPVPIQGDVASMGRVPASLLEVLPVLQHDLATFRFLRQTRRENNAAIVAPGAVKPTSIFSVEGVPNELRVFAHLSDPVDKYLLADVASLERFIADELLAGLNAAVEDEILNGDGTAGHLRGLLATSGIQSQAAAADSVTTVRAGVTKLEATGHDASVIVLAPADWAEIETARNTSGAFDLAGPVDRAARKLWGVQVVLSNTVPARTGLVFDGSALAVDTDRVGVETKWSDAGELFDRNQLKARVEGRFSVSVFQPSGVVALTLPTA